MSLSLINSFSLSLYALKLRSCIKAENCLTPLDDCHSFIKPRTLRWMASLPTMSPSQLWMAALTTLRSVFLPALPTSSFLLSCLLSVSSWVGKNKVTLCRFNLSWRFFFWPLCHLLFRHYFDSLIHKTAHTQTFLNTHIDMSKMPGLLFYFHLVISNFLVGPDFAHWGKWTFYGYFCSISFFLLWLYILAVFHTHVRLMFLSICLSLMKGRPISFFSNH